MMSGRKIEGIHFIPPNLSGMIFLTFIGSMFFFWMALNRAKSEGYWNGQETCEREHNGQPIQPWDRGKVFHDHSLWHEGPFPLDWVFWYTDHLNKRVLYVIPQDYDSDYRLDNWGLYFYLSEDDILPEKGSPESPPQSLFQMTLVKKDGYWAFIIEPWNQ